MLGIFNQFSPVIDTMGYNFIFVILLFVLPNTNSNWALTNVMLASTKLNDVDQKLTMSVRAGAELAMKECATQFSHEVWPCPITAFNQNQEDLQTNRETAYIHAVVSAGVAHTISRNCSAGNLNTCGCERDRGLRKEDDWKWGGCSDNLLFGEKISKKFLDTDKFNNQPRSLAILHNNKAGRIAVRKMMKMFCKCHGVSGSCSLQVCWRQIGNFQNVGAYLKKQYKRASKVDLTNGILKELERSPKMQPVDTNSNAVSPRDRRTSIAGQETKINKRKLIFLKPSPDYCKLNAKLGYKGVIGKTCEVEPDSKDQTSKIRKCTNLCKTCGLHVKKQVVIVASSCNCKFVWCCRVSCDTCNTKKIVITCTTTPSYTEFIDMTQNSSSGNSMH